MSNKSEKTFLTSRFALALSFANAIHSNQLRKDGAIPYVSHLMAVSASVLEYGGGETEAVAALLHDSVEDCGGPPMLEVVRAMFGDDVALIVESCSETYEGPMSEWRPRKESYIAHLRGASPAVKLVAGCDKLHNLNSMVKDLRNNPPADYWKRFSAGADEQSWFFRDCLDALSDSPVAPDLKRSYLELASILNAREAGSHGKAQAVYL